MQTHTSYLGGEEKKKKRTIKHRAALFWTWPVSMSTVLLSVTNLTSLCEINMLPQPHLTAVTRHLICYS